MIRLLNRRQSFYAAIPLLFFVCAQLISASHFHAHDTQPVDTGSSIVENVEESGAGTLPPVGTHLTDESLCSVCFLVLAKDLLLQAGALPLNVSVSSALPCCTDISFYADCAGVYTSPRAPPSLIAA